MKKSLFYLIIIFGIFVLINNGCKKDSNKPLNNTELLIGDSSKIWYLTRIDTKKQNNIKPTCFMDDERQFMINGLYIVDNMGTIVYVNYDNNIFGPIPAECKDTVNIVDTFSWKMNSKMDTLTISNDKFVSTCKILKLTTDSLIINRMYNDSTIQKEYYATKKTK